MIQGTPPDTAANHKEIARTFLRLANAEYQDHRLHRGYYAKLAKQYGFTNQEIADEYGVTEGAVRHLLKREAG